MRAQPRTLKEWEAHEHARVSDMATSHAAARSMRIAATTYAARILADLRERGPGNFSMIAARMQLAPAQVWRRLSDLKNAKLIEPTGTPLAGATGRKQTVWRACANSTPPSAFSQTDSIDVPR